MLRTLGLTGDAIYTFRKASRVAIDVGVCFAHLEDVLRFAYGVGRRQ